jgi:hypothetical protein
VLLLLLLLLLQLMNRVSRCLDVVSCEDASIASNDSQVNNDNDSKTVRRSLLQAMALEFTVVTTGSH